MLTPITTSNPIRLSGETETASPKVAGTQAKLNEAKTQLNASIVQASIDVSISSKNQPLALLLKTAINDINDLLAPEFGENALQNAASQDNTPEGTAGRIVSLSTGFYESFKKQHVGEDETEVLKKFMDTVRSGFEQGFKEASDILHGMGVLNGDVASGIEQTRSLVQQGYADFEAAQSSRLASSAETQS
ncbi:MAG: hypothetical protein H6R15_1973 [Proteobacteria bacterium]|nr:hypothetical protein [Pseudomonadota bacterium]